MHTVHEKYSKPLPLLLMSTPVEESKTKAEEELDEPLSLTGLTQTSPTPKSPVGEGTSPSDDEGLLTEQKQRRGK